MVYVSVIVDLQKRCPSLGDGHQRETLFVVICMNWATDTHWYTKLLDTRKGTQLNLLRQEGVNIGSDSLTTLSDEKEN